jgi:hypothetical protein
VAKTKSRWSETAEGRFYYVDDHGEVMAKIVRGYDWIYTYKDKESRIREFISADAAKEFAEKDVGAL